MSNYDVALFLHLLGVICFFSGLAIAASGSLAARRCQSAAQVAVLLRLARVGVLLFAVGLVTVVAFGFWLLDLTGHDFGDGWVMASLGLLVVSLVLGAFGGQRSKRARLLAEGSPGTDDAVPTEVRRLITDPLSIGLNAIATVAAVAILLLMVWKPGA
jgi:uncharacterized membrane protein